MCRSFVILAASWHAACACRSHTVSGESAGGSMAMIHAMVHSRCVAGVGVFAGSSYGCNVLLNECGQGACGQAANYSCISRKQYLANEYLHEHASKGLIDGLSNWVGKPAYLFSGTGDQIVYQCVMENMREQLAGLGALVHTDFSLHSAHGWVVDGHDFPQWPHGYARCGEHGQTPQDCGFDLSAAMFMHLKGPLRPIARAKNATSFYWIRQSAFVPDGVHPAKVGLDEWAVAYVPDACAGHEATCALHVQYHPCGEGGKRSPAQVKPLLWVETPYVAEANDIVVLYPQTVAGGGDHHNPEGCWDWQGLYPSQKHLFDTHSGAQVRTVIAMVDNIASAVAQGGGRVFPAAEAARPVESTETVVESAPVA